MFLANRNIATVTYCPHCDGPLFKGKRVAVVVVGNYGVEAAIDLAGLVSHVTLIEFGAELRADAVLQRKLHSLSNVTVITSAQTTEIHGDGQKVNGLSYTDSVSGTSNKVELEGVFVQICLVPNTEWLKGTLALWRNRDRRQRTNFDSRRIYSGRCDHRAVQADRDRSWRGR